MPDISFCIPTYNFAKLLPATLDSIIEQADENIEIVNENVYKLLSHQNIVDIYSISSSVVYESLYFGKEGTYFYKSLFDFYDSINQSFNSNRSVSIYESYFNPSFWSDILSGVCSANDCRSVMLPSKTSRL